MFGQCYYGLSVRQYCSHVTNKSSPFSFLKFQEMDHSDDGLIMRVLRH